jgi:hypothetical protein
MSLRRKPDSDTAERLRQFTVVCKIAFQIGRGATVGRTHMPGLINIGVSEFDLSENDYKRCVGAAQNFIAELSELSRLRKEAGRPATSEDMRLACHGRQSVSPVVS